MTDATTNAGAATATGAANGAATKPAPQIETVETSDGAIQAVTAHVEPLVDQEAAPAAERPAWLPEKFKTPEELLKSYTELEKRLGAKPQQEAPAATAAPKTDLTLKAPTPDLPFEQYAQEIMEKGDLSEDSYKALKERGIPKDIAKNLIDGQIALRERSANEIMAEIGGRDKFAEIGKWAVENLPPEEVHAFNKAVATDPATARLAVRGLHAKYEASVGREPNLVTASGGAPSSDVYESWEQAMAVAGSPEYHRDPAVRARHSAKLARSKNLN